VPVAAGARIGESGCKVCLWVRGRLEKLMDLTAEAESSPTVCLSLPEPRRKEGDGADGRDPPVSDRVRERGRGRWAREALGPDWAVAKRAGRGNSELFLFSFIQNCDICLILCKNLCADPKIMRIFV